MVISFPTGPVLKLSLGKRRDWPQRRVRRTARPACVPPAVRPGLSHQVRNPVVPSSLLLLQGNRRPAGQRSLRENGLRVFRGRSG